MKYIAVLSLGILLFCANLHKVDTLMVPQTSPYFIDVSLPSKAQLAGVATNDPSGFHLFSHGRPGSLLVEGRWLSGNELSDWIENLDLVGAQQINIYGCNFGKGKQGKKAVAELERELGIPIAASDDITGKNGDWELEVGGAAHRVVADITDYPFDLQDTDGDGVPDAQDLDDDNDGILDPDENGQTDQVFRYSGNDQYFIVPANVTEIQVKVWGAGGGGSNYSSQYGTGGAGGYVSGSISVVPGTAYAIMVGQGGISDNNPGTGPIYGFGGERTDHYKGSFGGGLSGVFMGTGPIQSTSRPRAVMVAGGGGAGERSTFSVASGGQGGDPNFGGGTGTMQGGNSPIEYGGGGGGGYDGGLSGRVRLTSDATTTVHGEGGTNYLAPFVSDGPSQATGDLAVLANPYAVAQNIPPNVIDLDYELGVGVGTSVSSARGGHGLVVISYRLNIDTDGDGTPDYLDLDSDGDGCSDANEAYGDSTADGGDNMAYGTGAPTLGNGGVNAHGLVVSAGIDVSGQDYTNTIATTSGGNQLFREGMVISVTGDPMDTVVSIGNSAVFSGSATAVALPTVPPTTTSTDLLFTWQVSTDNGATFTSIPGENGVVPSGTVPTLTVNNVAAGQDGDQYRIIFFNEGNVCYEMTAPATLYLATPDPSMSLRKSVSFNDSNGDGIPQAGETLTYDFDIINTGSTVLNSLTIADPLLGGTVCSVPTLPVGGTYYLCSTTYTLTQMDLDQGAVSNQATVRGTAPDGTLVEDLSDDPMDATDVDSEGDGEPDDPTVVSLQASPRIRLVKTGTFQDVDGDGCSDVGEWIRYRFVVTNGGNVTLDNVLLEDVMLGGIISGPMSGDVNGNGRLEVNETWIYGVDYPIGQADIDRAGVDNQATVEATAPDGTPISDRSGTDVDNDEATHVDLCQRNGMTLQKTGTFEHRDGNGIPRVGEHIRYVFEVINSGNTTLEGLELIDSLLGGTVCARPVLEVGERMSCEVRYPISQMDIEHGSVTNQAIVLAMAPNGTVIDDLSDDPTVLADIDSDGDGDPDDPTVTDLLGETDGVLEIFNGMTPDGDGLNDHFEIRGIADFPQNHVSIFNRWGVLVWEIDGYDEGQQVFRGYSNGRATVNRSDKLPSGTYFYTITITSEQFAQKQRSYSGFLYIDP